MSLIIKGMEMPKSCFECPFMYARSYCLANSKLVFDDPDYSELKGRYNGCPLVPLPAGHGKLIDKQAFKADIDGYIECMTKVGAVVDGEMLWGKLLDALDNAETIVPAEGGNADG